MYIYIYIYIHIYIYIYIYYYLEDGARLMKTRRGTGDPRSLEGSPPEGTGLPREIPYSKRRFPIPKGNSLFQREIPYSKGKCRILEPTGQTGVEGGGRFSRSGRRGVALPSPRRNTHTLYEEFTRLARD